MGNNPLFLSKSQFIRGLQCYKSLYLYKIYPELRPEVSAAQEAIFQRGTDVGILAQQTAPGGLEIPYEGMSFDEQARMTQEAINSKVKTIYEATFLHDGVFARVDILTKKGLKWVINEVKASTEVKDTHVNDVAFQYYLLRRTGLPVSEATVVHINNEYVRDGKVDVNELFTYANISEEVMEKQNKVEDELESMRKMLLAKEPKVDIGPQCDFPYKCEFKGHCWKHIPENSIFDLMGGRFDPFEYYRKGQIKLKDISADELPWRAKQQLEAELKKKDYIDKDMIKEFLDTLWYPMAFLDFETFTSPVPLFEGTWPYQQVPFQYSLHVQGQS